MVQRGVRMSESDQNSAEIDGSAGESRDLPEYNISAEISDRHVSIEYNGVTIVDSKHWSQLKKEQQHRKDKQLCHCFWCLIGRSKIGGLGL